MGFLDRTKNNLPTVSATTVPSVPSVAVPDSACTLPAQYRALALERKRYVELVNFARQTMHLATESACQYVALNYTIEFPLLTVAGKNRTSALKYSNYRVWAKRLQSAATGKELEALADRYFMGARKAFGDPRFWQFAKAMYLNQNRLPATQAYKLAVQKMRSVDAAAALPTFAQFQWQLNKIDPKILLLAREGEEALKNKYLSYIDRDWSDVVPGDLIVCDSRDFDTRCKIYDTANSRWIAVRPHIAGLMDARSWYLASYCLSPSPINSDALINTVALYLHNTNGVPPATAYCDNGSDYCAGGFSTPLPGTQNASIFNELGIKMVNAIPYNARAKTIERMFKDMMQTFDKLFPDYLGSRPGQRTQAADYYDTHAEDLPSFEEFCKIFALWLDRMHTTPRHGKIHQGKSPAAIWAARPAKPPIPAEQLQFAFLRPVAVRQVGRGGTVVWRHRAFDSEQLFNHITKKVIIKRDLQNDDHVFVFTLDGALICEAKAKLSIKALALDDPSARDAISAALARQRREAKQVKTAIKNLTGGFDLVSPLEIITAPAMAAVKTAADATIKVKGKSHAYIHHTLTADAGSVDIAAEPIPDAATVDNSNDDADDDIDLTNFHNFMTNQRGNDDD